ncbi:hypothetical protein BGW42_003286 [Actinomortierella wolfii]|nr:hypothetical protein BGW42_003286 [Actinomortierella wolfii]
MASREAQVASVLAVYPHAGMYPGYVRLCLQQHPDNKAVEEVLHKMAHLNFSHFPTVKRGVPLNSTQAKNIAMRRLVQLFPEVDLAWLRHQLHQHEHSHFYRVLDTILLVPYPQRLLPTPHPRRQQPHRQQQQRRATFHTNNMDTTTSASKGKDQSYFDEDDAADDAFDYEPLIERWEYIRSPEYIQSVRRQLYNAFPKIWKSTIKAVMAENNFDYLRTYDRLVQLEAENSWSRWLSDVFSFIQRAKVTKSHEDPLEFLEDLALFHRRAREQQSAEDEAIAREINATEYSIHGQTIECGCCFSDFCFEEMASCQDGHLFCKECIRRYVQEGLFGQGDLSGGQGRRGGSVAHAIRCIESSGCQALFSEAMLEWALTPELYEQYTRFAFQADLERSGLDMVRCPFCDYAEVDEPLRVVWLPWQRKLRTSANGNTVFNVSNFTLLMHFLVPLVSAATFLVGFLVHTLVLVLMLLPLLLALVPMTFMREHMQSIVDGMVRNIQIRRRGQAFHCKACGRTSCLNCSQERKPFHKCHENLADGLRLQVEKAMTEAVKRTFRAISGPCTQCQKCDLYMVEKDEEAAKKAAKVARAEYLRMNPMAREHLQNDQMVIGPVSENVPALEDFASSLRLMIENVFEMLFIEDVISLILQSLEVEDAEQNVIHQLLDFAHRYTVDVFQDALLYSEHAGTNEVGLEDVRLAIQGRVNHSFTSPPPKEFLLELAEAKNKVPLPLIPDKYGIRLPPERHCLTAVNFQLIPELPPLGTQSAPELAEIKPDPNAMDTKETPSLSGFIKKADSDEEMDDVTGESSSSAVAPPPELTKNQQNLADHDQWKRKRADDDDDDYDA